MITWLTKNELAVTNRSLLKKFENSVKEVISLGRAGGRRCPRRPGLYGVPWLALLKNNSIFFKLSFT